MKKTRTMVVKSGNLSRKNSSSLIPKLTPILSRVNLIPTLLRVNLTPTLSRVNLTPTLSFGGEGVRTKNSKRKEQGFTLVELIVVIVILGVLSTIAFLAFGDYPKQARDTVRVSNLKEIEKAIELYKIDNGDYPIPTNAHTGEIEGLSGIVWYKGKFGEELGKQIKY